MRVIELSADNSYRHKQPVQETKPEKPDTDNPKHYVSISERIADIRRKRLEGSHEIAPEVTEVEEVKIETQETDIPQVETEVENAENTSSGSEDTGQADDVQQADIEGEKPGTKPRKGQDGENQEEQEEVLSESPAPKKKTKRKRRKS